MVNTLLLILYALIGVVMAIAGIEAFRAKIIRHVSEPVCFGRSWQ